LFTFQFSEAWFDFYGKRDAYTDYFQNSVSATKAQKLWSITELKAQLPNSSYGENLWGLTASDSINGYTVWGGPPGFGKR